MLLPVFLIIKWSGFCFSFLSSLRTIMVHLVNCKPWLCWFVDFIHFPLLNQDASKASPNTDNQSPEVTSKAYVRNEDVNDSVKILTERLSAALVNVSAKDDLVKQHSKVAEEAVAGI